MYSSNTENRINRKSKFKARHIGSAENLMDNNILTGMLFKPKVNEEQLALIAGNLAQIYKDGIQITTALELVIDILYNKQYKKSLSKVLVLVKQGKSLSEAFSEYKDLYPEFFVGMIAIGESTGKLYTVLKGMNIFYMKCFFVYREIKSASAYPIFVFISMTILSIFFLNKVVPSFCEIYKDMNIQLPAKCKVLYDLNITLKSDPLLTMTTISSWTLILIILVKYLFNLINIDMFKKIKIVKLFFEYIMILLFSIITSTGINISQALEYCENSISFNYLRKKIRMINKDILKGKTLTEALEKSEIFSKYTLAVIKIREEGGTIEEGFRELSYNLESQLSKQIKKYLTWINPIFMGIMASFIVGFVLEFVIPLFDNLKNGMR